MYKFFFSSPPSIIVSLLFAVFCAVLPLLMFIFNAETIYKGISLIMWVTMLLIMLYNSFARRIEISQNGVRFKSLTKVHKIRWESIREIGITSYAPYNKGGNYPFVFFSTVNGNSLLINKLRVDQNFILVRYRKKIIQAIRKYWDKEIINQNYYEKSQ